MEQFFYFQGSKIVITANLCCMNSIKFRTDITQV